MSDEAMTALDNVARRAAERLAAQRGFKATRVSLSKSEAMWLANFLHRYFDSRPSAIGVKPAMRILAKLERT